METQKIFVPINQDGIIADVEINISVQCLACKHLAKPLTCDAFSMGIPREILNGKIDHSKPIPGQDNDVVFERRK